MSKSIEQLKSELALHQGRVKAAERALREAKITATGLSIGDVVKVFRSGLWQEAVVREFRTPSHIDGTRLVISLRRRGGDWSLREEHYDGEWRK